MKAFFISIAVFVALGFFVLTSYAKIGQSVVDKVILEEGNRETVLAAFTKDEKAFVAKYQPLLDRRWKVGKIGVYLDEAWFIGLSKQTVDLYAETPLVLAPAYGEFIFERALRIESGGNPALFNEAFALYKQYQQNFPNGKHAPLVRSSISRMMTKYGMQ